MIPTVFSEFERFPKLPEASVATATDNRSGTIRFIDDDADRWMESDTFYEVGEEGEVEQ